MGVIHLFLGYLDTVLSFKKHFQIMRIIKLGFSETLIFSIKAIKMIIWITIRHAPSEKIAIWLVIRRNGPTFHQLVEIHRRMGLLKE